MIERDGISRDSDSVNLGSNPSSPAIDPIELLASSAPGCSGIFVVFRACVLRSGQARDPEQEVHRRRSLAQGGARGGCLRGPYRSQSGRSPRRKNERRLEKNAQIGVHEPSHSRVEQMLPGYC